MRTSSPELTAETLKDLATAILAHAKKIGASAAEVNIAAVTGLSVNVRQQETEELTHHQSRAAGIHLYHGKKQGSASCSDLTMEGLKKAVEAAWQIAQKTDEDPYAGLADSLLMAKDIPDLSLHHPWALSTEKAITIAKNCEAEALATPGITNSEGASLSTQNQCDVYANSHGFCESVMRSYHHLSCTVVAEHQGQMQRDYGYTASTQAIPEHSIALIGREAAARTVRRLNPRRLKTQKASVIFAADVARSLFQHFISAISGSALYRRASFLTDSLGEMIFPEKITIQEQPYLLSALGSTAFDSEGVATRAQKFIAQGRLERYVLSSYSARRLALETTANADGVHNLIVSSDDLTLAALLKTMGTGLLITELLGQGANLITGDYSRGASGFWVENGEIAYPVENITVASHLRELFSHILAVGNDVETRGNIRTGSVWVENMMIGGT